MDVEKLIFESYNKVIEESYNELFENIKPEDILKLKEGDMSPSLEIGIRKWECTSQDFLGKISPKSYFDKINDVQSLMRLFKIGSKICDSDIPELLLSKLESYKEDTIDEFIKLATKASLINDDEEMFIPLMSIKILGKWKETGVIGVLIDQLYAIDETREIFIEEIIDALVNIGEPCVDHIVKKLNCNNIDNIEEYLLYSLVRIATKTDDKVQYDEIYSCIKSTFLKMDNKIIGAMCLGDLGDGRAIPFLRGYVEKNLKSIDYETFCEIKAAIHKLGGNMDDINFDT
ncbi:UNVERIFIED_CONTAM: hypothetical protein Cloal_3313 [Acetivibrio alkalicellulosi]